MLFNSSYLDNFINIFFQQSYHTECAKIYLRLISGYIDVKQINEHSIHKITSGSIFFTASIILFGNLGQLTEKMFDSLLLYDLLYILVDNYMDEPHEDRRGVIKEMQKLLIDSKHQSSDKTLQIISEIYNELLGIVDVKNELMDLFNIQVEGLYIQNRNDLPLHKYYQICKRKGEYTLKVLVSIYEKLSGEILPISIKRDCDRIGKCMQIIDDIVDVTRDKNEHIHTIATKMFTDVGNLDTLINKLCKYCIKIKTIISYKVLYYNSIVYILSFYRSNFSRNKIRSIDGLPFLGKEMNIEKTISDILLKEIKNIST